MTRTPSSSLSISSLSKQQSKVALTNGSTSKAKALMQMIAQLKKEKKEYEKTNQHLLQSTQLIYQQNQKLKDAIVSRKVYFNKLSDRYIQSTKTLQAKIDSNKRMSKVYLSHKNKTNELQLTDTDSMFLKEESDTLDLEIADIEKSATHLFNKFSESEKKVNDYKILLSLYSRLTNVNKLLTKQAKNCFSIKGSNPELFKPSSLNKLKQKMDKGEKVKKELFLHDENDEKIATTKKALNRYSDDFDRFLSIYDQVFINGKRRMLMSKESSRSSSRSSSKFSSKSNQKKEKAMNLNENASSLSKTTFSFDDEIDELRRIVGTDGFDYLNNRRVQNLLINGKHPFYDAYESTELEKENHQEEEDSFEYDYDDDEGSKREEIKTNCFQERDGKIDKTDHSTLIKELHLLFVDKTNNTDEIHPKKGNKIVKSHKKQIKRPLKSRHLKAVKQDVSVQARRSMNSVPNTQSKETETNNLIQESSDEQKTVLPQQTSEKEAKQRQCTIGNELIMEFLFKELASASNKSVKLEEKVQKIENEKTEIDQENNASKNKPKPFFDESDQPNNLDFYTDSYNLEESTTSVAFDVESPRMQYKYIIRNGLVSELSLDEQEEEPDREKDISEPKNADQTKKEKTNPESKDEETASEYQLNRVEFLTERTSSSEKVNNVENDPKPKVQENPKPTKETKPVLSRNKLKSKIKPNQEIIEEETASEYQLDRIESLAEKTSYSEKVNNSEINRMTKEQEQEKPIKTPKLPNKSKSRQRQNAKPAPKILEEETGSEYQLNEFELLTEKTSDSEKANKSEINLVTKEQEKPTKTPKLLNKSKSRQRQDTKPELNILEEETASEYQLNEFELLIEKTSNSEKINNSEINIIDKEKEKPTKAPRLPNKSKSRQHLNIRPAPKILEEEDVSEYQLNEFELLTEKTSDSEKVVTEEINTETKRFVKAKQTKKLPSKRKQRLVKRIVSKCSEEEETETEYQLNQYSFQSEKAKPTRIPLSHLVHFLQALNNSGVHISESPVEEGAPPEFLLSEIEDDDSEKAIRTGKFILGNMPVLETSSESEQEKASKELLSLLELEGCSETPKSSKESNKRQPTKPTPKLTNNEKRPRLLNQPKNGKTENTTTQLKNIEDDETASEYQLNEFLLQSDKTSNSDLFVESHQPERVNNDKVDNKTKQTKPTKPNLVKKPKNRSRSDSNLNPKSTEEDETASEYQLNEFEYQSEKEINSDHISKPEQTGNKEINTKSKESEKTKQTRTPLSQLVHFLQVLHNSGVHICDDTEEGGTSEYILNEKEDDESEKTNRTEKSILSSMHQLETNSESEQKEAPKELLSLLELEGCSESPKSPKESNKRQPTKPTPKLTNNKKRLHLMNQPKDRQLQDASALLRNIEDDETASEYQLNEFDLQSDKISNPEKVDNEEISIKPIKQQRAKQTKPKKSYLVNKAKNRLRPVTKQNVINAEEDTESEYQLNDFESDKVEKISKEPERIKQTRIPLSQLVHILQTLHNSGVHIGEKEDDEETKSKLLLSQIDDETEDEVKKEIEEPMNSQKIELTSITNPTKPKNQPKLELPKPQEKPTKQVNQETSKISISHSVHLPKNKPQLGPRQIKYSAEESSGSEHILSETEKDTEKAIQNELEAITESDQPEKEASSDLLSLIALEEYSETINSPKESKKSRPFGVSIPTKPAHKGPLAFYVHLPNGSPGSSVRQLIFTADESTASEYLTSEIGDESEIAIQTEKFFLANIPEPISSTEPEQIEHEEGQQQQEEEVQKNSLSLLDLEDFSETVRSPKEPKKSQTLELTPTKASLLNPQPKELSQQETKIYKLELGGDDLISVPKSTKKETKPCNNKKTNAELPVQKPKKPERVSTYDRSVFYTPIDTLSCFEDEDLNNNEKVQITVTLKDIGLDGLDSFRPNKPASTNETKKNNERKSNQQKENKQVKKIETIDDSEVVFKLDPFVPPSTARRERPSSASSPNMQNSVKANQKQASLLDSTQKAQKCQAIKPKTTPKCTPKFNNSGRSIYSIQMNECNQEDRSSKRFFNDITERLPPILNRNGALPYCG